MMLRTRAHGGQETIVQYKDLAEPVPLLRGTAEWRAAGTHLCRGLVPDRVIDAYTALRKNVAVSGFPYVTPYLHYRELRDLCLLPALLAEAAKLIDDPPGLHLNLTGWVSTERDWHSDSYLNPEGVDDAYVAVWVALEDIDPDSGPFQYIPGSHQWPVLRRSKLFKIMGPDLPSSWPGDTQDTIAKACLQEAVERGATVATPTLKRGDVLFWHPFLIHRGSPPNVRGTPRRACIAHYSSINRRPDMSFAQDDVTGGHFAVFSHGAKAQCPEPTIK